MKKYLLLNFLLLSFIFLITPTTAGADEEHEKPRLLVVPLKARKGIDQDEATLLTDVLSVAIYRSGMFTILNRDDMKAVLTEKEFEIAIGCDDNVCLLENVAKLAVNKLIAGNIGKLGKKYIISLRLINADGHNEAMEKESCNCKIEVLDKAIERLSYKLLKYLGAEVSIYGSIRVESEPPMAKINVDGTHLGTTPDVIRYIEPGPHKIEVIINGYKKWIKNVNVESSEEEVLIAILRKKTVSITTTKKPVPTDKYLDSSFIYSANNSKIFHRYNCSELNTKDLIEFNSEQAAINAGGIPCIRYNPSQQEQKRVVDREQIAKISTPFFQNSFLRVTLKSISKSTDKTRVNLVLMFENISREDILVAMKSDYARTQSNLLDDAGVQWELWPRDIRGLSSIYGSNAQQMDGNYSMLTSGTKNIVTMVFKTSGHERSEGRTFHYSANALRYTNRSPIQFSIGISDMKITK